MAGSGHACLTRKKEEGRDNAIMVASGQGMSRGRARAPHSGPGKRVALLIIREGIGEAIARMKVSEGMEMHVCKMNLIEELSAVLPTPFQDHCETLRAIFQP